MKYYKLLLADKAYNDRYLSSIVYSEKELINSNKQDMIIREHLFRYPDDILLEKEFLLDRIQSITIEGYQVIDIIKRDF